MSILQPPSFLVFHHSERDFIFMKKFKEVLISLHTK